MEFIDDTHDNGMEGGGSDKYNRIELLSNGAYGCIYYPGFQCNGKKDMPGFVTKIQMSERTTENEWEISQKIRKIQGYARFFAPIVQQCPVKMTRQLKPQLNKCEVIQKYEERHPEENIAKQKNIVSNRIRYVGENDLNGHIMEYMKENAPRKVLTELIRCHIYLNRGIQKLIEKKIVHYDIRYNNIVYDDVMDAPLFIDFGLSIDMSALNEKNYDEKFFNSSIYPYWCMESFIASYIFREMGYDLARTEMVNAAGIQQIIDSFVYENGDTSRMKPSNDIFLMGVLKGQKERFMGKWKRYLVDQFTSKTYFQMYEKLADTYWKTWDNYALCVVFLFLMDDFYYKTPDIYDTWFHDAEKELTEYIRVMGTIVFNTPDQRYSIEETNRYLRALL